MKKILLGDEAYAQGVLDAGLSGCYAYPGTPSTEIMEYVQNSKLAAERGIHREWSSNEKTAMEEALGNFAAFRRQEGEAVQRKFEEKLQNIATYLKAVEPYEQQRTERIRQQITDRLSSLNADYDRNRLEEEMIIFATEEVAICCISLFILKAKSP